jgi:wyosine [tRNA(Phe)-imidazoG37] synthetase (radical SAM superfamily)
VIVRTVFGPVPSRRFGRSLGVDVIPRKLCTLDCVYCEVGRTDKRGLARREYIPNDLILNDLREALAAHPDIDCVTFSGSGEPTLHAGLGELLRATRRLTSAPLVVLTNGTLLWKPDVREDLMAADIVCPSLDAVSEDVFRRIDRPHPRLTAVQIIDGLVEFRRQFSGKIWLEVLFVQGMNDDDEEVWLLRQAIDRIAPDKVQINTVVRPPAEPWARPVPHERLELIRSMLGPRAEIISPTRERSCAPAPLPSDQEIVNVVARRPMSAVDVASGLGVEAGPIVAALDALVSTGRLRVVEFEGQRFYAVPETGFSVN